MGCWIEYLISENFEFDGGITMKRYEYKFVEIKRETGLKVKAGDTFEKCKEVIIAEAEQGWKLQQIISPFNEKAGVYAPYSYQIIFEREV